jgi:hypothetical protein
MLIEFVGDNAKIASYAVINNEFFYLGAVGHAITSGVWAVIFWVALPIAVNAMGLLLGVQYPRALLFSVYWAMPFASYGV